MKIRALSLAALLCFGATSSVSALRIQSRAIELLNVSQLSYSENTPFEVRGKIWGKAPVGEVTRILYKITDSSNTKTWEFAEPFVRTFDGTEELNLTFEFDFSDTLVDTKSNLSVELQKATMNGAFAQTLAQGTMSLVFPEKSMKDKVVSQIETFRSFVDGKSVVSQIYFKNLNVDGDFYVKAQLLDLIGNIIEEKKSVEMAVPKEEGKDISILFDMPKMPGRYKTKVQVFGGNKAVTGVKESQIIIKGDFAVISELSVTPERYFYVGDIAKIHFSGASSSWEEPLTFDMTMKDSSGTVLFSKEIPIQTDEIGRFSGDIDFTLEAEVAQLQVLVELRRGAKNLGTYEFATQKLRKLHAAEGQSKMAFAIEKVSQDFMFSGSRAKIGMLVGVAILILLILGFIFLVHHVRHTSLLLLILAFSCSITSVDAAVTSFAPADGWIVNPLATGAHNENFKKLTFQGVVDLGIGGIFPIATPIDVIVKSGETVLATMVFQTSSAEIYEFAVDISSGITDGAYPLELEMTWPGITLPGGNLEIELLRGGGEVLSAVVDTTAPIIDFGYFGSGVELGAGDFSNVPVELRVGCDDMTGCLSGSAEKFEVNGNFCSGEAFCETGVDDFILCDQVGNCSGSEQVEIQHYDPVAPVIGSFDLKNVEGGVSAKIKLKAFESYVFSVLGLSDPTEATSISIDSSACAGVDSPFFVSEAVCKEKVVSCAFSPTSRGTLLQTDTDAVCEEGCPPGTSPTIWGTCQAEGCSYTSFPFCFDWVLDGQCNTFPFCFSMILD